MRGPTLWLEMDLDGTLFKRGCCGGGGILVVNLCHRASSLRWRWLQCWSEAREVVQESVQACVCEKWKMMNLVLGSCVKVVRSGFLLRWCHAGVPEFDDVSRVLPQSDSFNGNGFAFGKLLWRSAKLMIAGAASSSGEEVICLLFLEWLLRWCRRQVTGIGFFLRGFLSQDH
jgi:hypothetical protein